MRWLLTVTMLALTWLTGCKGGAPYNGSLLGSTPTLPANATFNGNIVAPPATGSYAPTRPAPFSLSASGAATPNPATGFQFQPGQPNQVGTNPYGSGVNPNTVANSDQQSPFWQRYQPLSLNGTAPNPTATSPGFASNNNIPPAVTGFGMNSNAAPNSYPPPNLAGVNPFNAPAAPTGFQPAGNQPTYNNWNANGMAANNAPNGGFNYAPGGGSAVPTYAGNNPILSWANSLNRMLFSQTPQPGQWQSWTNPGTAAQSGSNPFSTISNSSPPSFNTGNVNSSTNIAANAPNWQNRPETRSIRTTSDTYAPEPAVRIPDSALAGSIAPTSRPGISSTPSYPPPSYPASPNAVTQPVNTNPNPLPPRSSPAVAAPSAFATGNNSAWPELTRFPKAQN